MKNKRNFFLTLILFFTCFVSLFLAYTKWMFWEPSDFSSDSLIYTLKVPEEVKLFPTFNPNNTPSYDFRIADGVTPETIIQTYQSNLSLNEIKKKSETMAFQCRFNSDKDYLKCEKIDNEKFWSIYIYSKSLSTSSKVSVEVIFQNY